MRVAHPYCRGSFAGCSRLRHFLAGDGVDIETDELPGRVSEGRHTGALASEVRNPTAAITATSRREQS